MLFKVAVEKDYWHPDEGEDFLTMCGVLEVEARTEAGALRRVYDWVANLTCGREDIPGVTIIWDEDCTVLKALGWEYVDGTLTVMD